MNKEISLLLRDLSRDGFEIRRTRRGHHLILRDGLVVTAVPGTPSDWRSLRNTRADLRRAGYPTCRN